jgi:hypothetical protein
MIRRFLAWLFKPTEGVYDTELEIDQEWLDRQW